MASSRNGFSGKGFSDSWLAGLTIQKINGFIKSLLHFTLTCDAKMNFYDFRLPTSSHLDLPPIAVCDFHRVSFWWWTILFLFLASLFFDSVFVLFFVFLPFLFSNLLLFISLLLPSSLFYP